MRSPRHVRLDDECQVLLGLDHYVIRTPHHPKQKFQTDLKFKSLLALLNSVTFSQALVFTNFVLSAEAVCEKLEANGWPATYIAAGTMDHWPLTIFLRGGQTGGPRGLTVAIFGSMK